MAWALAILFAFILGSKRGSSFRLSLNDTRLSLNDRQAFMRRLVSLNDTSFSTQTKLVEYSVDRRILDLRGIRMTTPGVAYYGYWQPPNGSYAEWVPNGIYAEWGSTVWADVADSDWIFVPERQAYLQKYAHLQTSVGRRPRFEGWRVLFPTDVTDVTQAEEYQRYFATSEYLERIEGLRVLGDGVTYRTCPGNLQAKASGQVRWREPVYGLNVGYDQNQRDWIQVHVKNDIFYLPKQMDGRGGNAWVMTNPTDRHMLMVREMNRQRKQRRTRR